MCEIIIGESREIRLLICEPEKAIYIKEIVSEKSGRLNAFLIYFFQPLESFIFHEGI